jgi:hypothetical protein
MAGCAAQAYPAGRLFWSMNHGLVAGGLSRLLWRRRAGICKTPAGGAPGRPPRHAAAAMSRRMIRVGCKQLRENPGSGSRSHLHHDLPYVGLHGLFRDAQLTRNLFIRPSFDKSPDNVVLTIGQTEPIHSLQVHLPVPNTLHQNDDQQSFVMLLPWNRKGSQQNGTDGPSGDTADFQTFPLVGAVFGCKSLEFAINVDDRSGEQASSFHGLGSIDFLNQLPAPPVHELRGIPPG